MRLYLGIEQFHLVFELLLILFQAAQLALEVVNRLLLAIERATALLRFAAFIAAVALKAG